MGKEEKGLAKLGRGMAMLRQGVAMLGQDLAMLGQGLAKPWPSLAKPWPGLVRLGEAGPGHAKTRKRKITWREGWVRHLLEMPGERQALMERTHNEVMSCDSFVVNCT